VSAGPTALERECHVLARYLGGRAPSRYVVERYLRAHETGVLEAQPRGFDRTLVRFAGAHPLAARIADAHARLFAPRSALRDKLVLLLALLETSAPSHRRIDDVAPGGLAGTVVALGFHGLVFALCLAAGLLLLGPARLLAGRGTREV